VLEQLSNSFRIPVTPRAGMAVYQGMSEKISEYNEIFDDDTIQFYSIDGVEDLTSGT
jgi:hypothetical protein